MAPEADGSSAVKVYFDGEGFQIWEKAWHIPRVGECLTKDGKVYVVNIVNYKIGALWHVEIFTKHVDTENNLFKRLR